MIWKQEVPLDTYTWTAGKTEGVNAVPVVSPTFHPLLELLESAALLPNK